MAEILLSFDACLCVFVCASSRPVNQHFQTVKATDFKFDKRISRDSPGVTPYFLQKWSVAMVT